MGLLDFYSPDLNRVQVGALPVGFTVTPLSLSYGILKFLHASDRI